MRPPPDASAAPPHAQQQHNAGAGEPLSNSQRLIATGQRLTPDSALYNMVLCFRIHGALDVRRFVAAFAALLRSNAVLRGVVREQDDGELRWHTLPIARGGEVAGDAPVELLQMDRQSADRWVAEQRQRHFALEQCLYHCALLDHGPEQDGQGQPRWTWYLNLHHLVTDGMSTELLFQRMSALYAGEETDALPEFPAFAAYRDHEREFRSAAEYRAAREFWQQRLQQPLQRSRFYGAGSVPAHSPANAASDRSTRVVSALGEQRSERLLAVAQTPAFRGLTPDMGRFLLLATVLVCYLHRIGGMRTVRLGVPFHNRPTPEFKQTLGLFMEICPLQVEVEQGDSFATLAAKLRTELMTVVRHARAGVSSAESNRAYDVLLNYVNIRFGDFAGLPTAIEWVHAGFGDRHHSLRLQVHDFAAADRLELLFDFNCGVFDQAQQQLAITHFLRVADVCMEDPQQPLGGFDLLDPAQRKALLDGFQPPPEAATDASVLALIQRRLQNSPMAIAVLDGDQSLDYQTLMAQADAVARALAARGIGSGDLVGLLLPRSAQAVVALLGVLRSGAAFVPLDPDYPDARIVALASDFGTAAGAWLISCAQRPAPAGAGRDLPLTELIQQGLCLPATTVMPQLSSEQPAYVIYTSGSTGQPKGVLVSHGALLNYVAWARQHYVDSRPASFPLYSSLCFDLTLTSLFVPLSVGGRIVVYASSAGRGDLSVRQVVQDNRIQVLKLTPSHLRLILDMDLSGSRLAVLILGGEKLPLSLARQAHAAFSGRVRIENEYGPTEATIGCMHYCFDPAEDGQHGDAGSLALGQPIANSRIYLLDRYLQPVPPGVPGELYLAGAGLALGYLGRADETASRFVKDPFHAGQRMYRSGDRAIWRADGKLEYLGRLDEQIKVNGVRLEPAELEQAISAHPQVSAAAVRLLGGAAGDTQAQPIAHCQRCGLPSNYPGAALDATMTCSLCRSYDSYRPAVDAWFSDMTVLRQRLQARARRKQGEHDALVLLSGGKDSTYMLYQVVAMGFRVKAMSLDNGFISAQAMDNIRRVVSHLGVEHRFVSSTAMNTIFADSLRRHQNVCNGCFKTIYTLSLKMALAEGIPAIVTGLSRGQLFETRLGDLFGSGETDPEAIDRMVLEARKAYHREQDVVASALDTAEFADDRVFEQVSFIDFYRYLDVELSEVYDFLDAQTPWQRPTDTGRSTNCQVNDVGIWVHKHECGYHNYAMPYSWDVRLGHKQRDAALQELDDELDPASIEDMLSQIGYQPRPAHDAPRLVAWYQSAQGLEPQALQDWLRSRLPAQIIPSALVAMDALPLTANGKLDSQALPDPRDSRAAQLRRSDTDGQPSTAMERALLKVWTAIFRLPSIGIHDDFFDLGGDSIINIQLCARARREGIAIQPEQVFEHSSVAALALVAEPISTPDGPAVIKAAIAEAVEPVSLLPIQQDFLDRNPAQPEHWHQRLTLELADNLSAAMLEAALTALIKRHDGLRLRFAEHNGGWRQSALPADRAAVAELPQSASISEAEERLLAGLQGDDLQQGRLLQAALIDDSTAERQLLLLVHHLGVDALSWRPLLQDLESACQQMLQGQAIALPAPAMAFTAWAQRSAQLPVSEQERTFWQGCVSERSSQTDHVADAGSIAEQRLLRGELDAGLIADLNAGLNGKSAKKSRAAVPAEALIIAALLQAWQGMDAGRPLAMDLERHGRDSEAADADLMSSIGWFTTQVPLPPIDATADAETLVAQVVDQLRAIPRQGIAASAVPWPRGELLCNYLGELSRLLPPGELLRPLGPLAISCGPQSRPSHPLQLDAWLQQGRLVMEWRYAGAQYSEDWVNTLQHGLGEALQALLATLSDAPETAQQRFPDAGLSGDELDELLADL